MNKEQRRKLRLIESDAVTPEWGSGDGHVIRKELNDDLEQECDDHSDDDDGDDEEPERDMV